MQGRPFLLIEYLLILNQRDGTFRNIGKQAGTSTQVPQVSRGMAVGDSFNDGKFAKDKEWYRRSRQIRLRQNNSGLPLGLLRSGG
jgi:hypothetical protein